MMLFASQSRVGVVMVCALVAPLAACRGERAGGAPPVESRVGAQTAAAGSADLLVKIIDGNGDRTATATAAPPAPGVIVRLRGGAAFEAHAAERQRGGSARRAREVGISQRGNLRGQHDRLLARLAGKLNGLPPRRGRGRVVGASYDDFTDAINAVVLHGVDVASAQRLLADEAEVLSIAPLTEVQATLPESVPLIDADDVWALPDANGLAIDGAGMRIGIVDTGVDYSHPDLGGCFGPGCRVAAGYDFVNDDPDPVDDHGHGTHVAATAAGNGTYSGSGGPTPIRGVAPGAQIYAYKVLNSAGSGSSADIIAAIQRCADPDGDGDPADHLDVCSLSLGGGGDPDDAMSVAVDNATAAGVVFTVAAGNAGPGASTIGSPGTSRRAITVGATCKPSAIGVDSRCAQAIASFSSRGPVVWNTSSGQQTLAKPDLAAPGVSICAAEWATYQAGSRCLDGRHISISGTSMATPLVAGVAALLRQAHPEWTPEQVKICLVTSAHDLGLPATAQGSGQVDALDALTLGGLPSNIARVGGTPLRDVDVPTGRFATFTSDLTITNTTGQPLAFSGSFAGVAGLTATLTPASVSIDPGATATVTVARQVDHDVIASGTEARGTITLSSAQGDVRVGLQVGVRDRLTSAPATVDLGVDLASQTSWTGQTTLTLSNLRADAAATYSASIACCNSGSQSGGTSVTATLDQTSVTIGAGGTASLGVTVQVNNPPLFNGRFSGTLTLASPLQTLVLPVTFFKGYGLRVDTTPTMPELLSVSSAQSGSQFINPVPSASMLFLSTTPGPFFVEARWPGGMAPYANYHVLAGNLATDVPVRSVTLDKASAVNTWELRPIDQSGAAPSSAVIAYRFTHSDTGGGTQGLFGFGGSIMLRVSDVPAGDRFTASVIARSPDPIAWFYDVAGPVSGDRTLTNTPAELVTRDLRLSRPVTGTNTPYLLPWACLTLPFSAPPGGAMFGGGSSCTTNGNIVGGPLSGGAATMRFYNQANRDLLAATAPDAPSIALEINDGSATAPMIYRVAHVNVSATHAYSWHVMLPFSGTIRPSEAYARFLCEESPSTDMLPLGLGPLVDQWGWYNHRTDMFAVRPWRGSNLLPFGWGGCLQDMIVTSGTPSYRLFRNGVQVAGGALSSNFFPFLSGSDGAHRFELTRGATIGGASTTIESVTTFSVSSSSSIDENPPQLHELHMLGRGLWQEVIDPGVANRLRFTLDPAPGFNAWASATPPQFTLLPDSLAAVGVQQGSDGATWTDVPVTALGGGVYSTEGLDPGPTLLWLRINASDAAGNTLRYTFQLPRGTAYAPPGTDVTPPTAGLTAPTDGATVFGHVAVSATASDNVGVARVDLFVDGARAGSATAAPYVFDWDSAAVPAGPHQLQVRAYDAADNLASSAPVSVTVVSPAPPTVTLTAPAMGALVGGTVTVSAATSDDAAVARVDFLDGGTVVGMVTAPPFSITWHPATTGTHSLTAQATDRVGRVTTSAAVTVTADLTAPTVAMSAPANGSTVQNTVNVSASASDGNGIAAVDFYRDGTVLLGTDTTSPYTIAWNTITTPAGVHTLTAVARDGAGNSATSAARTVTVKDVTTPVVAITAPASGTRVPVNSVVTIEATASDLNGVVRVEFYVANKLKCSVTTAPYTCAWTVPGGANKNYTLQARAVDAANNTGTSANVTVTSQ